MKNYILNYRFEDENDRASFSRELKKKFPEHKIENYNGKNYFTFPAKNQPAVKGVVNDIKHRFDIGTKDYIALYFTRSQSPDEIQREMLLGRDEYIETDISKKSVSNHKQTLAELMEFDFLKARIK